MHGDLQRPETQPAAHGGFDLQARVRELHAERDAVERERPEIGMHGQRNEQGGAAMKVDAVRAVPADAQVAGALQLLLSDAVLQKRIRVGERQSQACAKNADLDETFGSAIGVLFDTALHVDLLRQQADSARQGDQRFRFAGGRAASQSEREASGDRLARRRVRCVTSRPLPARRISASRRSSWPSADTSRNVSSNPRNGMLASISTLDDGCEAETPIGSADRRGTHTEHRHAELQVRDLAEALEQRHHQLQRGLEAGIGRRLAESMRPRHADASGSDEPAVLTSA